MKKRLLAALLALTLLLTACQYAVVEDETDVVMGLPGSAAIGEEAPDSEPLARGSRDQDGETAVQALQERLAELNFLSGKADGIFGAATENALKAFQAMNGLEETGKADAETCAALEDAGALPMPTSSPTPLASGARGEDVSALQEKLREYGFLPGGVDGDFGGKTDAAVKKFAQYMYDTQGEEFVDPTPTPQPTATPTPRPERKFDMPVAQDEAIVPEEPFSPSGVVSDSMKEYLLSGQFEIFRQPLSRGDRGDEVVRLQTRLQSLRYLDGNADGQFGGGTESALKYFQKRNKLEETGKADETTQRLLFSAAAVKSDRPQHPYLLKVDTAKQRVYAYQWANGSYSNLVRTMVCSTGTYENPTPLGTFSAGGRLGRWYYFNKFDCWAQYAYQITGPYYFHSVLYSEKDTSTLRQGSVNNLGSRASHGCIRLAVEDAKWIYNNCAAGTTVKVV